MRKASKTPRKPRRQSLLGATVVGTINTNIKLPTHLHQTMQVIRQRRREMEGSDVKLCRIYKEAVEQYVNATAQQRLLRDAEELRGV